MKALLLLASLSLPLLAQAAEPESCATVRFSDVGWTDITVTTAIASEVLESLGYTTKTTLLSIPVTYRALASGKDLDVFLGNWMPTTENDIKPFRDAGTVETVRANLHGAKYTLRCPTTSTTRGCTTSPTLPDSRTNSTANSTASNRATTATA
jgi:glycine betaine/proline transport system substrate-binding protein